MGDSAEKRKNIMKYVLPVTPSPAR
jgi:hypothetical protein